MASAVETVLPPRYTSVEALARGGMGEIYRACDATLGRDVAVKVLSDAYAHDAPLRARFKREALAAARLSNEPHIVTIYDVGEWNGRPYIVMELASRRHDRRPARRQRARRRRVAALARAGRRRRSTRPTGAA